MAFEIDQQLIADYVDTEVSPLQALWARVYAQAAELDPEAAAYDDAIRKLNPRHQNGFMAASQKVCWMTSVKQPARGIRAGRTVSCPPMLAARLIVGGTHRTATAEEIKLWHLEQDRRKEEAKKAEAILNPPAPAPVNHFHLDAAAMQAIRTENPSTPAAPGRGHGAKTD